MSELCCIADAMCMRITTGGAGEVCIAIVLTVSVTRTAVRQVCTECDSGMEERRQWFSRSLHLWQQDRRQRDAVVIAENHDPPETLLPNRSYAQEYPNLELVAFKHNKTVAIELCERETPFVGEHELIALNVARQRSQRIRNATYVVMISGRYYIPSLLDMIAERLTRSTDIITMATVGMGAGCSIMGCRNNVSDVTATSVLTDWARSHPKGPNPPTVCDLLWRCPFFSHHCENTIRFRMPRIVRNHQDRVLNLPEMYNAHTRTGSHGDYRDTPAP